MHNRSLLCHHVVRRTLNMEDVFLSIQWSRFPLKKLKISSLLKNVPIFYGVRSVITVFV